MVAEEAQTESERLWGPSGSVRAFLSHKADSKVEAAGLKEELHWYGISAFLAHEDITPTREWQDEILLALRSMHLMIPLLTAGFQQSEWTGQEIGFALGRTIPIIPIRFGSDPYGFIGRYQAMNGTGQTPRDLARTLFELMLDNVRPEFRRLAKDAWVHAVSVAPNFRKANELSNYMKRVKGELSREDADSLLSAFNANSQVAYADGFEQKFAPGFQDTLAPYLSEVTGGQYTVREEPGTDRTLVKLFDPGDLPF